MSLDPADPPSQLVSRPPTGSAVAGRPLSYRDLRRWLGLIVLFAVLAILVWALESVLLLFAVVFLIAMVLNPLVAALEKRGLNRALAVGLLLIAFLAMLTLALVLVVPPLLDQIGELTRRAPEHAGRLRAHFDALAQRYPVLQQAIPPVDQIANTAGAQATGVASFLLRSTFGIAGGILAAAVAVLLLVFVLSNPRPLVAGYLELVPERHRESARRLLVRLLSQMKAWVKGVVINGTITGVSTGLLMWWIGVQPALVFGALCFLGEFLPNIGPVIMAIPALFVAASMGAGTFGLALLAILFVQQIETNLLVPFILSKEMDLNPVSILFFTLAMGSLFGLAGAILAVPAAALTKIMLDEFYLRPRRLDRSAIEAQAQEIVSNQAVVEP
ncbi:MAG: AI-2E family transporter [Verrucomicrobiota bacterium]